MTFFSIYIIQIKNNNMYDMFVLKLIFTCFCTKCIYNTDFLRVQIQFTFLDIQVMETQKSSQPTKKTNQCGTLFFYKLWEWDM